MKAAGQTDKGKTRYMQRQPGAAKSAWLLLVLATAGCGGGYREGEILWPEQGTPPPVSQRPWHGYSVGTVEIDGQKQSAEALLTVDGQLRIYILGRPEQWWSPVGAIQVVAEVAIDGDRASGSGVVLGEACSDPSSNRFCGSAAGAEVTFLSAAGPRMSGEIRVATGGGTDTWKLDTADNGVWWNDLAAGLYPVAGLYREELAEFAEGDDVIISVDGVGQLFFQGAGSGCTASGTVLPHLDGTVDVYDVRLTIANCVAEHGYLNGDFEGLASRMPASPWDYGTEWVRTWLSSVQGAPNPVALTLWWNPQ